MAGSCAEVLFPRTLTEDQWRELHAFIQSVAGSTEEEGRAFWITGQPFSIYEPELDEERLRVSPVGWVPQQAIGFCAGCRGQTGDLILAMLVTRVAEMFGGLIAFGGSVESFTNDPSILTLEGRYAFETGDILIPNFMYYWVGHPQFKMVN